MSELCANDSCMDVAAWHDRYCEEHQEEAARAAYEQLADQSALQAEP